MNKAELVIKLAIAKSNLAHNTDVLLPRINNAIEVDKTDINNFKTELAELTKAKTGRVKIGDDLSGVGGIFYAGSGDLSERAMVLQGRAFYDRPSAELFALREATEFKIWCEFGNDVRVDILPWLESRTYLGVCYACRTPPEALHKFIDTLSPEELNSIRSE